ncbi:MAG: arginyltransferase [Acidobacteria bacterium]|nr:arginyltransferase [Acidobacteriota bacterium]
MTPPPSPERPRHFLVIPHRCVYFGDRDARSQVLHPVEPRSPAAYSDLARSGFRRSGADLYRPRCETCEACVPTRVAVERFRWGRRFRRVLKKNADLTVGTQPASPDPAGLRLYDRYIRGRHADGEMYPPSPGQLLSMVRTRWAGTFFLNARLDGRLVATAVTDTLDDGLAAVYTFFDPDLADRSLGVFAILQQVEECRRRGLPYLYLGFWIAESAKMRYKIEYQPAQLLIDGRWREIRRVAPERSGP